MSRLSKLYEAMETLVSEGLELSPTQEAQLRKAENEIIQNEILPVLTEKIEPVLGQIKRELVLVVDYVPNQPLKVSLSRKRNITDVLTDAVEISPKRQNKVTATDIKRSAKINFKVTFADGYICDGNGKDTFINALRHMNLSRVATFKGRTFADFPLVGHRQRVTEDHYKWQEHVEGWWIYINMGNETKIEIIKQVAKFLGISLKVEAPEIERLEHNNINKNKRAMFSLNGGQPMNKRTSVLNVVKLYISEHPEATFAQIKDMFPDYLQGSYGVVKPVEYINRRIENGHDDANRYFLKPSDVLISSDNISFAVCHQWGDNFQYFISHIERKLRWVLKECY